LPYLNLKKIKRVAGASVGGIVGLLVALNLPPSQIREILQNLELSSLLDEG